jgi:predicted MPP superfamily phosphohydrolase
MLIVLLLIAAAGHAVLWIALVNRLHGLAMKRTVMNALTALCGLAVALIPLVVAAALVLHWPPKHSLGVERAGSANLAAWSYVALCAVIGIAAAAHRLWLWSHAERRGALISNHTERARLQPHNASSLLSPGVPALLGRLPGNQVVDLQVRVKQLAIPNLPPKLVGLRIAHLSDLHMSGRIAKSYFEQVAACVNESDPDLIAITGDIVERNACIDWIPDTLARLRAPGGVHYVLGNHDRKVDKRWLTIALAEAGLVHLGGQTRTVKLRNHDVLLAGNELPWHGRPPEVAEASDTHGPGHVLRVVLTHTPDQFGWAQANNFDLMMAGHTHGGQVCLPYRGAVLVPSLHGARYAEGVFRAGRTVMHVSRGTASLSPLRYNCPPEIAVLVLQSAS